MWSAMYHVGASGELNRLVPEKHEPVGPGGPENYFGHCESKARNRFLGFYCNNLLCYAN
jgi:hypothetical protein